MLYVSRPGRFCKYFLESFLVVLLLSIRMLPAHSEETGEIEVKPKHWYDAVSMSLEFSDISYHTLNDEVKVGSALDLSNVDREAFGFDLSLDYEYDEEIDSYTKNRVSSEIFSSELKFSLTGLFHKNVDFASQYNEYEQETADETRKYDIELSPVGATFNAFRSKVFRKVSFSYLPQYNFHEYYFIDEDNIVMHKKIERSLRHTGIFDLYICLFEDKLSLGNKLTLKKTQLC